jgi:hypothetical protein
LNFGHTFLCPFLTFSKKFWKNGFFWIFGVLDFLHNVKKNQVKIQNLFRGASPAPPGAPL